MRQALSLTAFLAVLVLAGCSGSNVPADPAAQYAADPGVVAVIAGEPLTLGTFETEYARSYASPATDSLSEYEDFLDRYVNFRLKVREARALGFDRDSAIIAEIAGYRTNLARPYLLENEVIEPVVRLLYDRGSETIDASHILIRVGPDASPADTMRAYQTMRAIVDSVGMGIDFGDLAYRNSEDPSARNERRGIGYRGRLGYFSAGRMVEEFEDNAYATPVGELSPIFRTRFGYHVMKVEDRMAKQPDRDLSHILIRVAGQTRSDSAAARALIERAKQRLAAGETFQEVAGSLSQDAGSARQGGRLGVITFDAPLVEPFKDVAFAMERVGDVDEAETQFGFHLIRLNDIVTLESYEEAYPKLKDQAARLPRSQRAEQAFAKRVMEERGLMVDTMRVVQAFQAFSVDSMRNALVTDTLPADLETISFAQIGSQEYTLGDLADYARANGIPTLEPRLEQIEAALDGFLNDAAIGYEVDQLEQRDADFAATMQQFKDGLILFKLMEEQVWNVAAEDSVGLRAYHAARASDYRFDERTRILSFYAPTDSLAEMVAERLDAGMAVPMGDEGGVEIDTTYVTGMTQSLYDRALAVELGQRTEPFAYRQGKMILVRDGVEMPRQKTFAEARTEVVSDYQEVVEDRLMAELRAKYGVATFPSKLTAAFAEARAERAAMPGAMRDDVDTDLE